MTPLEHQKDERKRLRALAIKGMGESTPKIKARGAGVIAQRIITIAREYSIPIKEDSDLVEILSKLDLDKEIPDELYPIIAEILSFFYKVNLKVKREKEKNKRPPTKSLVLRKKDVPVEQTTGVDSKEIEKEKKRISPTKTLAFQKRKLLVEKTTTEDSVDEG